jgi:hypothetical protein
MVAVSGAFHTSRMDSAAEALKGVMAEVRTPRACMPPWRALLSCSKAQTLLVPHPC